MVGRVCRRSAGRWVWDAQESVVVEAPGGEVIGRRGRKASAGETGCAGIHRDRQRSTACASSLCLCLRLRLCRLRV